MSVAYVDTSCLVAIAFDEPGSAALASRLAAFEHLIASNLLEAELRSAFLREGVDPDPRFTEGIAWILPERRLTPEIDRTLAVGQVRGADLWHLACALYVAESPADIAFASLDERQRQVAALLGFAEV